MELRKHLSLSLIVIKRFQRLFHVDPNLDILFAKLTAQIGAWVGLGTHLFLKLSVTFRSISLKCSD